LQQHFTKMENPIEFSSGELAQYEQKFNVLTKKKGGSLETRVGLSQKLPTVKAFGLFSKLKVSDVNIEAIWRLIGGGAQVDKRQFMLGLRLCSGTMQGKDPSVQVMHSGEIYSAQPAIVFKKAKTDSTVTHPAAEQAQTPDETPPPSQPLESLEEAEDLMSTAVDAAPWLEEAKEVLDAPKAELLKSYEVFPNLEQSEAFQESLPDNESIILQSFHNSKDFTLEASTVVASCFESGMLGATSQVFEDETAPKSPEPVAPIKHGSLFSSSIDGLNFSTDYTKLLGEPAQSDKPTVVLVSTRKLSQSAEVEAHKGEGEIGQLSKSGVTESVVLESLMNSAVPSEKENEYLQAADVLQKQSLYVSTLEQPNADDCLPLSLTDNKESAGVVMESLYVSLLGQEGEGPSSAQLFEESVNTSDLQGNSDEPRETEAAGPAEVDQPSEFDEVPLDLSMQDEFKDCEDEFSEEVKQANNLSSELSRSVEVLDLEVSAVAGKVDIVTRRCLTRPGLYLAEAVRPSSVHKPYTSLQLTQSFASLVKPVLSTCQAVRLSVLPKPSVSPASAVRTALQSQEKPLPIALVLSSQVSLRKPLLSAVCSDTCLAHKPVSAPQSIIRLCPHPSTQSPSISASRTQHCSVTKPTTSQCLSATRTFLEAAPSVRCVLASAERSSEGDSGEVTTLKAVHRRPVLLVEANFTHSEITAYSHRTTSLVEISKPPRLQALLKSLLPMQECLQVRQSSARSLQCIVKLRPSTSVFSELSTGTRESLVLQASQPLHRSVTATTKAALSKAVCGLATAHSAQVKLSCARSLVVSQVQQHRLTYLGHAARAEMSECKRELMLCKAMLRPNSQAVSADKIVIVLGCKAVQRVPLESCTLTAKIIARTSVCLGSLSRPCFELDESTAQAKLDSSDLIFPPDSPCLVLEASPKPPTQSSQRRASIDLIFPPESPRTASIPYQASSMNSSRFLPHVVVNTPELVNPGWFSLKMSYNIYSIETYFAPEEHLQVQRRFKDLEWFFGQVILNLKGFIVPPLPEKRFFGNTSKEFVEERRAWIEKFLCLLLQHPFIGSSSLLKDFLSLPREELKQLKAQTQGFKWPKYQSLEDAFDRVSAQAYTQYGEYFGEDPSVHSIVAQKIGSLVEHCEGPTQTCVGAFGQWVHAQVERQDTVSKLRIEDFTPTPEAHEVLKSAFVPKLNFYFQEIQEEQLRVEGLKNAVSAYSLALKRSKELENLLARKQDKHKHAKSDALAAQYLKEVMATQEEQASKRAELEAIEDNLKSENSLFLQQKYSHMSSLMGKLASFMLMKSQQETCFWFEAKEQVHSNMS
jgi:hypothetical protein